MIARSQIGRDIFLGLWAILAGLVGAAVLHAFIILASPYFASQDIWNSFGQDDTEQQFLPLRESARDQDPFVKSVICRFDLSDGPVRISAEGDVPFWSASVFDRRTTNIYSLNDRTAVEGELNLLIANSIQTLELRQVNPDALLDSVLVQVNVDEGFIILRSLVPDDSWSGEAQAFLDSASCDTEVSVTG